MNEPCRRRAIWAANQEKSDGKENETLQDAAQPAQEVSKYICSKCGKEYRRGMYFHFKNCKG